MAKDPAFLFYSQDWIVGANTLTMEDRGKFITILAQMHQQGRMKEETICFLVSSVSDNLRLKFDIDENGFWYNKRLEFESEKRANFTSSRRKNGSKGGRPRKSEEKQQKPYGFSKVNHMGNENEDSIINNANKKINTVFDDFLNHLHKEIDFNAWLKKSFPTYHTFLNGKVRTWAQYFIDKRTEEGKDPFDQHPLVYFNSFKKFTEEDLNKYSISKQEKLPH